MFRVLLVGTISQTTEARRNAFLELGVPLDVIDEARFLRPSNPLNAKLTYWTHRTPGVFALNRELLGTAERTRPDVIWIEKGVAIFPRTLRALREADLRRILVYHNTDDWRGRTFLRRWLWRFLLRSMDLYDVHISSNFHNVKEFREAGFRHVHHMELASNPALTPVELTQEDRRTLGSPVGFIGHWESYTEGLMRHLVSNGIDLKIYGGGWEHARARELEPSLQHRSVWGEEYVRACLSFDIHLGIISAQNRSHTASRTFQVPALGAFLLHQRNDLVTRYFREGEEIACFESKQELLEKCRYYLDHPEERQRVAAAGQRRCVESGYSETDRVREALPLIERVLAERRGL